MGHHTVYGGTSYPPVNMGQSQYSDLTQRGALWRYLLSSGHRGQLILTELPYSGFVQNFFLIHRGASQRYCHPPENMEHLRGKPHHSSGASTELRILEFYLYTYNLGLNSTVRVLLLSIYTYLVSRGAVKHLASVGGFYASGYVQRGA